MPSAAILAGGRATRFGGLDKGAAIVHGRSILDRQLTELAEVTDDILFVGARPPSQYRALLREVADNRPGLGPLAGLDAALGAARDDTVLVLAGDMPFLTAAFLAFMARLADDPWSPGGDESIDAVVPRTERGWHPLAAAYRRTCHAEVRARLDSGHRGHRGHRGHLAMRGLLEGLRVREVGRDAIARFGDPDRLLANVNTPADLDLIQSLAGHTR